MSIKKASPKTVAANIIATYGADKLQQLIDMFRANESGTVIGVAFGISRQRVSQWKASLGTETVTFEVSPDIADLVDQGIPKGTNRSLV